MKDKKSLSKNIKWNKKISSGGFADIYPIYDRGKQIIAVAKVSRIEKGQYRELSDFYRNEVKMLKRFKDVPTIVNIIDNGFVYHRGVKSPVIYLDYVPGVCLHKYIRRQKRDLQDFAKAIADIAELLLYFEAEKVIYRDMKSANIIYSLSDIVGTGKTTLIDFNLSIDQKDNNLIELTGTKEYFSPEQATGKKITTKTDIFSLGGIVYEYYTKRYPSLLNRKLSPFKKTIEKIIDEVHVSGCPDNLLDAVKIAMRYEPSERSALPLMEACSEIAKGN
ncbi:MAG: protein kinase [Nanoarchaeota archaeon]|nr:protein kinase [Nanoarchaeota archaeon]MBU1644638.1 protein kinase [Nanoarchaeota archaeon]MBU1976379.1 protein kinase [Nanoarchaeota archaeon]